MRRITFDCSCLLVWKLLEESTGLHSKEGIVWSFLELCLESEHNLIQLNNSRGLSLQQQHNIMENLQHIIKEERVDL